MIYMQMHTIQIITCTCKRLFVLMKYRNKLEAIFLTKGDRGVSYSALCNFDFECFQEKEISTTNFEKDCFKSE